MSMDWRKLFFKQGRGPTLIQMRLMQIVAVPTRSDFIPELYESMYGFEVKRGTIYTTLYVMEDRGWTKRFRKNEDLRRNIYELTFEGREVCSDARIKYLKAAKPREHFTSKDKSRKSRGKK